MDTVTLPAPKTWRHTYYRPDGTVHHTVIRTDRPDGKRGKINREPAGAKGVYQILGSHDILQTAAANTTVYVCEGEVKTQRLLDLGLVATTSGGSTSARSADWMPIARFNDIVILPDHDEPGRKYADAVVDILAGLPGQRTVTVVDLPRLAEGEDVADYLVDHTVDDLLAAVEEYGLPARPDAVEIEDWPEPRPVVKVLQAVPGVVLEMLPDSIGAWCFDAADRMQAPVDFVAVAAITMLGSLVGRQLTVRPKARDPWAVKPNVWACLIGQPAMMKSPALKEARRFLDKLDREAGEQFEAAMGTYERQKLSYETRADVIKKRARQEANDAKRETLLDGLLDKPEQPTRLRYYTQDSTVERLHEILQENSRGILMLRDELVGFLRGLDKPGQEGSRAFYLEAWEGNGRFHVDRIGRGSKCVDGICIGVLGNATPGGISEYVVDALGDGEGADGLLQRFGLVAFPDTASQFRYVDRGPDEDAAGKAEQAFRNCDRIDTVAIGAGCYDDSLPFLHYDDRAQRYFEEWYVDLVSRCRHGNEHPAISAHLLKFDKLVPALSLVFHVADGGRGPIPQGQFLRAASWADYSEGHARRLYESAFTDSTINGASILLQHIQAGDLTDGFTVRDVYVLKGWTGLSRREDAQAALNELVETGHLKSTMDRKETGGRPTERFLIHPTYREGNL